MQQYLNQETIETKYNKRLILKRQREYLENTQLAKVIESRELLISFINQETENEVLQEAKQLLKTQDIDKLVLNVLAIATSVKSMPLVSVASLCAKYIDLDDTAMSIYTIANVLDVLAEVDLYDLRQYKLNGGWFVETRLDITPEMSKLNEETCYMPPSITIPTMLYSNNDSGYRTIKSDSVVLGHATNHHSNPLALDVLNRLNRVAYSLDLDFLQKVGQEPMPETNLTGNELRNAEKLHQDFLEESVEIFKLMKENGNKFYFTNKYDKRGRIYSQGYHINPQGTSYKKAMLNLATEEVIEGYL